MPPATVLDRIVAHHAPRQLRKLQVAEWGDGDTPLDIHYFPVSLADLAAMNDQKQADRSTESDRSLWLVLNKALDKDGAALFAPADRKRDHALLRANADPLVVTRIATLMIIGQGEKVDA